MSETVYTSGTTKYHKSQACAQHTGRSPEDGRDVEKTTREEAERDGLEPCGCCHPAAIP